VLDTSVEDAQVRSACLWRCSDGDVLNLMGLFLSPPARYHSTPFSVFWRMRLRNALTLEFRDIFKILSILMLGFASNSGIAQNWDVNPWPASWITHPTASATVFAVVSFRRSFELDVLPDSLPVMVSADNRYQLFVNGRRVGEGCLILFGIHCKVG
jgi:hypothetical protein